MRLDLSLLASATATTVVADSCPAFPPSVLEFSSNFRQPEPPLVKSEFKTSFVQHKWDENLSNIAAGYITNSPSKRFVRVEEAFGGKLASSLFDYTNTTEDGLVDNTFTEYQTNLTKPIVIRNYVNSNYPIFQDTILADSDAVFTGLVQRRFSNGPVAAWSLMYQGAIPVTMFLDRCNIMVGYDYFSPGLRTRVVTDFFNIEAGSSK